MISSKLKNVIKKIIQANYDFNKFDLNIKNGVYLRFDVDVSINNALLISKYLKKKNIYGNFFFQPNNEIYNIFNPRNKEIINEIYESGHLIGLHIDEKFFSIKEKNILNILNFFKKNGYLFSNVISFHRPSKKVLKKKYRLLINTYDRNFFNKNTYLSDSGKNKFFLKKIDNFLSIKNNTIQILMHPIWWTRVTNIKEIYSELIKNNNFNLNNYLLKNFPKVFLKIVPKKKYLPKL